MLNLARRGICALRCHGYWDFNFIQTAFDFRRFLQTLLVPEHKPPNAL